MPVSEGGKVYGCNEALEDRAAGIAYAGREIQQTLIKGGNAPNNYTIQGTKFHVVKLNVTPGTNIQTTYAAGLNAARGGTPTLVVLPPGVYSYNNAVTLSDNTYLVAYGARLEAAHSAPAYGPYRHNIGNNSGIFGIQFVGQQQTISRWPERYDDSPSTEPAKNGSFEGAQPDGIGDTDSAFISTSGKSNCIVKDVMGIGSFAGLVRTYGDNGSSTNQLFEDCAHVRSTSDTFHFTHDTSFITVRRCRIFNSGDDCIPFVSYSKTIGPPPRNGWVTHNVIMGGRGRGIVSMGGKDLLFEDNTIADTNTAGILSASTSAHNTHSSLGVIARRNTFIRCGRRKSNFTHSGIAITLFSTSSGETAEINASDNLALTYNEWYAVGGGSGASTADFCREATGPTSVTEKNNTVIDMASNQ